MDDEKNVRRDGVDFKRGAEAPRCSLSELVGTPQHRRHSPSAAAAFERELGASIGRRLTAQTDDCGAPVIVGRRGFLHVFGPKRLGVVVIGSARGVRAVERRHREWEVLGGGDEELALIAPARDLQVAAREVRAYSRRHLTTEQRQTLRQRLQNGREGHKRVGSERRTRLPAARTLPATVALNGGQP